ISRRRTVMAYSARRLSFSASSSLRLKGIVASIRRRASLAARCVSRGIASSARKAAHKNPRQKTRIDWITGAGPSRATDAVLCHGGAVEIQWHNGRTASEPAPMRAPRARARRSERVPGGVGGQLQVADVHAEPCTDARADGHDEHGTVLQHVESQAGYKIGGARHADIAPVEAVDRVEVVDQHHDARTFRAEVPSEGWALPENPVVADILGVERAFAIGEPAQKRAGALL